MCLDIMTLNLTITGRHKDMTTMAGQIFSSDLVYKASVQVEDWFLWIYCETNHRIVGGQAKHQVDHQSLTKDHHSAAGSCLL